MLETDVSDDVIAEKAAAWVPGTKRDSTSALISRVSNMDDSEKKALMEQLKALGLV